MTARSCYRILAGMAAFCLMNAGSAFAHPGHGVTNETGFLDGAFHPLFGLDHMLAMLASGLLAVRVGTRRAYWAVPLSFIGLMLAGGLLAMLRAPLLVAEWGIALSVIVLGLAVALMPRVPLTAAAGVVGVFAVCHGYAHVMEAQGNQVLSYMAGFSAMTLGLHVAAIGVGLLAMQLSQPKLIRFAGAGIAAGFATLLLVV